MVDRVDVTNKTLSGPVLRAFMCGRGVHEKVYGELKSGVAFACVPTMRYAANRAWQLLSVLAFNLMVFSARDHGPWRDPQAAQSLSVSRPSTRCPTSVCTVPITSASFRNFGH